MVGIGLRKAAGRPTVFFRADGMGEVITVLEKELSYPVKGAEYAQVALADRHARENMERVARGEPIVEYPPWDGRTHFLKKAKNGAYYFPYGLMQRAKKIFSWFDIEVHEDIQFDESEIHGQFEWRGPELRDYQKDALVKAYVAKHGIVSLPTAAGKTMIALRLIWALGLNTVVFVHTRELLTQWCGQVENILGLQECPGTSDAVRVYRKPLDTEGPCVKIAMLQTVHSGMSSEKDGHASEEILKFKFDVLIADEAHHYSADTFYAVAQDTDAKYKVGFSATTEREDGEDMKMEAALGPICAKASAEDLINAGYLARPKFEFVNVPATQIRGRTFSQVYASGVVNNEVRNRAVAARALQLAAEGRQVYIHVEHVNHGKLLSGIINAPFVYSKSKDRDETISTFRKGYTRILISTLLGEGVDIPSISAIIMAGGRKTEIGTIQRVGRALRPDSKFPVSIIVDFADRGKYLSEHATARYQSYIKFYGENIVRGK